MRHIRDAQALPCGHYLSEEAPEETYRAVRAFYVVARMKRSEIRGSFDVAPPLLGFASLHPGYKR